MRNALGIGPGKWIEPDMSLPHYASDIDPVRDKVLYEAERAEALADAGVAAFAANDGADGSPEGGHALGEGVADVGRPEVYVQPPPSSEQVWHQSSVELLLIALLTVGAED